MIMDTLERLNTYAALHAGIGRAAQWLNTVSLGTLADGRIDIDGDAVFALVQSPQGLGRQGARLETHRRYADIQICVSGTECIGWAPLSAVATTGRGFDEKKDVELYDGPVTTWLNLPPGNFVLFFPEDAHAPLAATGPTRKIVIKIRVG